MRTWSRAARYNPLLSSASRLGTKRGHPSLTAANPPTTSPAPPSPTSPSLFDTHDVFNQSSPLESTGHNLLDSDLALKESLHIFGAFWAESRVRRLGTVLASEEVAKLAEQANRHVPELRAYDRYGHRVDQVEYHPAYHKLMAMGVRGGVCNAAWRGEKTQTSDGSQVARAALMYMHYQVESGTVCPMTMTFAAVPVLRQDPDLGAAWVPKLTSNIYDPRDVPLSEKGGATVGMSMTEKQGGSDVRVNTTRATPLDPSDTPTWGHARAFALVGHKWFCSAPMSDGFLTLAHTEQGLSCFLVPRWLPDGTRNRGLQIMRLKAKCGDASNASAEVEYRNAVGYLVGVEGRGVHTIIGMVQRTRLDCALGSAGLMRQAYMQVLHHVSQRTAFGAALVEQPLMANLLADMAIECEACTKLAMRMAKAVDDDSPLARIGTAVAKYWICKRAPHFIYEAMECIGGNGYVEDFPLSRHFRQSPLNSIWEGSGNIMCLDVLRAMIREPETIKEFMRELKMCFGTDVRYDGWYTALTSELEVGTATNSTISPFEMRARRLVDRMAIGIQASLLIRFGDASVAEAFLASRLDFSHLFNYGTLGLPLTTCANIIQRNMPRPAEDDEDHHTGGKL